MPTPYEIYCWQCNATLTIASRSMDSDGDVTCDVLPCATCMEKAFADGREKEKEEDGCSPS